MLAELATEPPDSCTCPATAAEIRKWGFTEPAYVRDIPIRGKRVRIYFRLQRKRCLKCRKTGQQPLASIDQHYALTARLVDYIGRESLNIFRNFAGVADEIGCNELTVRKIFTAHSLRIETGRVLEAPRWLAIDEVYPQKRGTPRCVISAPEERRVLELLPSDKEPLLLWKWLLGLHNRHEIEVVTMDMCQQYRSAVRRLLPQARIVVDRYHVHNMLNVALKGVLAVVRDSMTPSEQSKYMRRETLLLKNYRRLSNERKKIEGGRELPSEKEMVKQWLKHVPDLRVAYSLKQEFSDILQLTDRQKAERLTDPWLERVCAFVEHFRAMYRNRYHGKWEDPFGNVPNTVGDWRASILSYIDLRQRLR